MFRVTASESAKARTRPPSVEIKAIHATRIMLDICFHLGLRNLNYSVKTRHFLAKLKSLNYSFILKTIELNFII